jgi:hypothetical protein
VFLLLIIKTQIIIKIKVFTNTIVTTPYIEKSETRSKLIYSQDKL